MNSKIKEAMKKEKEIVELVNSAKENLCEKISNADTMEGVERISASPRCVSVSFKTLASNGSWSPSTYIPETQAQAVKDSLSSVKTAKGFQNKVEEMLTTGKVKVKGETITLNSKTKEILEEIQQEE